MTAFREFMDLVGTAVDGVGVFLVVLGIGVASWRFLLGTQRTAGRSYLVYRQDLGRAILLGLEFLVAGDIIRTVVVDPTLNNVLVLGVIVLIRTFLSMALQLELQGRWPWQGETGLESHP